MKLAHLVDISARRGPKLKDEIILRDKDRNNVGFDDTDEIRRERRQMTTINACTADQRYFLDGTELYIPPMARIFNETFRRGGRMYCQGSSYQQMSVEGLARIEMLMPDGELSRRWRSTFAACTSACSTSLAGSVCADGDLYAIAGYSREARCAATCVVINADDLSR